MKTQKHFAVFFISFILSSLLHGYGQSWSITGNANIAAGTNYLGTSDPNDLVFRTNALERGRVFGAGGAWRFGSSANNAQIDSLGVLTFKGNGFYQVAGNKYVFQYKNDRDYGLFFNSTNFRYEFRNSTADPVFYADANTGALSIGNLTSGVNYILPSARGTNNQVLKTDGSGNVSWSADNNTTYTAGTGLSLAGTTFTNTAPDQTVTLAGSNGITASGTYPHLSVNGNGLWGIHGNAGTDGNLNFIGTTDAHSFVIATNDFERVRITSSGNVGIGTINPDAKLHIGGGVNVSLGSGGTFIMGPTNSVNLAMDNNEIQARDNGAASTLFLNNSGGNISMGGNLDVTGTVGFGSVETFSDGGANTIASNSNIVPTGDNSRALGTSSLRWTELWATDGTINTSDVRDKTNIRDLNYGLKEIMQLRSVKFNWKNSPSKEDKLGVIAQEIQKVLPEVVRDYEYKTDEATGKKEKVSSERLGVMYSDIIPVLIKAIQEQQQEIEVLKAAAANNTSASEQKSSIAENNINIKLGTASVEQNMPNPLSNSTSIRYTIPAEAKNASLIITDVNGRSIKQVMLKAGSGIVHIDASSLNGGIYNYTLVVDGKTIDTKRMVVAK